VVGDEDVAKGKPHPEIYLKAAKLLSVNPRDCLAFEDSASGIKSAKSAGMTVVAVDTNKRPEALKEADYIVSGFDEIELV
jgi:beta-phosphoglucomutase-like phosphatase (HAD superfamily)